MDHSDLVVVIFTVFMGDFLAGLAFLIPNEEGISLFKIYHIGCSQKSLHIFLLCN